MIKAKPFAFLILLMLLAGCNSSSTSRPSPPSSAKLQETAKPERRANGLETTDEQRQAVPAIRIVVFQDKSRSVNETRTVQLTEGDFLFLIGILRGTSGELAFGIIDDRSDRPLLRLRIDSQPGRPTKPVASNPFERAELNAAYEDELATYDTEMQRWSAATDERIKTFLDKMRPLLQEKALAGRTNVYDAIARINLFASESEASWPNPTRIYALVNSDAVDTVHAKPVKINDHLKLVLVNGAGSTGVLGLANPLRFESVQAALDFVAASEKGGGHR